MTGNGEFESMYAFAAMESKFLKFLEVGLGALTI